MRDAGGRGDPPRPFLRGGGKGPPRRPLPGAPISAAEFAEWFCQIVGISSPKGGGVEGGKRGSGEAGARQEQQKASCDAACEEQRVRATVGRHLETRFLVRDFTYPLNSTPQRALFGWATLSNSATGFG